MCNFLPSSISSLESSRMCTANSVLGGGEVWWLDHTIPPSEALPRHYVPGVCGQLCSATAVMSFISFVVDVPGGRTPSTKMQFRACLCFS